SLRPCLVPNLCLRHRVSKLRLAGPCQQKSENHRSTGTSPSGGGTNVVGFLVVHNQRSTGTSPDGGGPAVVARTAQRRSAITSHRRRATGSPPDRWNLLLSSTVASIA